MTRFVAALLALTLTACAGYVEHTGEPPAAFVSDGCSGQVWRSLTGKPGPWEPCCVEHDVPYWRGGTEEERMQADGELLQCVASSGHPYIAIGMFLGVRVGGHPVWPTSWRWGFGWVDERRKP